MSQRPGQLSPASLAVAVEEVRVQPDQGRKGARADLDLVGVAAARGWDLLDFDPVVPEGYQRIPLVRVDLPVAFVHPNYPKLVSPGGQHVEEHQPGSNHVALAPFLGEPTGSGETEHAAGNVHQDSAPLRRLPHRRSGCVEVGGDPHDGVPAEGRDDALFCGFAQHSFPPPRHPSACGQRRSR